MDPEIQKTIQEKTKALPQAVKDAIKSVDIESAFAEIIKTNNLRLDQAGVLETEILLTILGMEPTTAFIKNIKSRVHVDEDTATKIASDVNEKIFKAIRMEMASLSTHSGETQMDADRTPSSSSQNVSRTFGADVTEAKLEGAFRLAPDSVVSDAPTKLTPPSTERGKYPGGVDPYREPVA